MVQTPRKFLCAYFPNKLFEKETHSNYPTMNSMKYFHSFVSCVYIVHNI